ncbi:TadE/TadG family type IV pilus assembly protein [Azospirillum isscasi]|uniref:Pilus assembly protein n=1 Tax=Azospirillum isscasi TaxID=3053926 RepID=A0ABU0WPM9_9PROT|nr:TadE family protein [Azospirillum isscasi]MDQ2106180.1 pilus assembly protein [Azospirillum isscasi]
MRSLSRSHSRPFLRALRDRRGLTTLELALVSPALIAGMIALAEVSYSLTVDGLLNHAARAAARSGFTGELATGFTDRRAQVCDTVRRLTHRVLDQSRLSVRSHSYASFTTLGQINGGVPPSTSLTDLNCGSANWDAGQTGAALGGSGQVVVYVLRYTQPVLTGLGATVLGRSELVHEARLAVRNEPFMVGE